MRELARVVEEALEAQPGSSARELVLVVRHWVPSVTKTEINSVLYSDRLRFWSDGDTPPRWRVIGSSPAQSRAADGAHESGHIPARAKAFSTHPAPLLYAWQEEALRQWEACGRRGVVEAVTGTGKTFLGIAAARKSLETDGQVLVLVPSIELQRQWIVQLRTYLPGVVIGRVGDGGRANFISCRVIVAVVNSARTRDLGAPKLGSLLVADECHRYGSVENAQALDDRYPSRLGLSATYARSDDGNTTFLDPFFGETCFRMDYRRAIEDGVTARFLVALIGVRFSERERNAYEVADRQASQAQRWLITYGGVPSEPFGEFMRATTELSRAQAGEARIRARSYLRNFAERRRVLAESTAKTARLSDLIPALWSADRSILFTETVEAADKAAECLATQGLAAKAIHSTLDPRTRRLVLSAFAAGELQAITAARVLDEGIDVPAADLAIILAASRTRRQMIQRMGRVLRRKADSRLARFAIFYVEGSSEDPERGAHGDFLDEVTGVAEEVRNFGVDANAREICDYLGVGPRRERHSTSTPLAPEPKGRQIVVSSNRASPSGVRLDGTDPGRAAASRDLREHIVALADPRPSVKVSKKGRDRLAAAAAGITVDELLARRRHEAARNLRLAEEAKRLGVSVKRLRRLQADPRSQGSSYPRQ